MGFPMQQQDDHHPTDSSRACIVQWLRGRDQEAARALMEALHPQVIRIVQNHLPRGVDAEDLAQDVFVQFFKTLDRYDPARPLENWVSRLALNVCLKALRARGRRPEWRWADLSEGEQAVAESLLHEPETDAAQAKDGHELLARLLDALSPQERMILTLLNLEEKSVAEIAALTGWNGTLVKVRAFRARAKLRKALETLERKKV
jgi:RNA polymerase sigma-70 factor (ECF subfamily)